MKSIIFKISLVAVLFGTCSFFSCAEGEGLDDPLLSSYFGSKKTLKMNRNNFGILSRRYNQLIGGVDFGNTAVPSSNFNIESFKINYDKNLLDGSRVTLIINNKPVSLNISDWLLFPIAEFSDTKHTACLTLREYDAESGGIHSAFQNTLLGMRVFVADLLFRNDLDNMPTFTDDETGISKAPIAFDELPFDQSIEYEMDSMNTILSKKEYWCYFCDRNYILTDHEVDVKFKVEEDNLVLEGNPYYLFSESLDDDQYIMTDLTNWFKSNRPLIQKTNPYVYDATTSLMQHAAFFRYIKANFPKEWGQFYETIKNAKKEGLENDPDFLLLGKENK